MPRFEALIQETILYRLVVEAPDEDSASEIAESAWRDSLDPLRDFEVVSTDNECIMVDEESDP
jgi:hypothetical protein